MKKNRRFNVDPTPAAMLPLMRVTALSTLLGLLLTLPTLAQTDDTNGPGNWHPSGAPTIGNPDTEAPSGPVRMARFSYIEGDVTWRGGEEGAWSAGAQNFPLRQGAQLWVGDNSRAEIQFDDGSRLRLDSNTLVTLQTLYSDTQGEFTEITLNDGQMLLRLKSQFSQFQVNTAVASLKAAGPGRVRVGSGQGAQFAVTQGEATIEGGSGSATLGEGGYLDVMDANAPFRVRSMPGADNWDQWNDDRDNALDAPSNTAKYCPPNIALVADNLDASGDWRSDPRYGHVWCPRDMPADWRPYSNGQWTWVEPFGWTWVGAESWGWAPYHYGTWVSTGYGWAWVPGPAVQYWSPATVSFYQNNGTVAWCPLAPSEVHYPRTMGVGFRGGSWSAYFSIGGTACYYPSDRGDGNYCVARPFPNHYVNHVTYVNVYHETNVYNTTVIRNVTVNNSTFVPSNARHSGGTQVSLHDFGGGHAAYRPIHGNNGSIFAHGGGGLVTAPSGHGLSAFGPPNVPVSRLSFTPTHSYAPQGRVPQESVRRPIFRAPLPDRIPPAAVSAGPKFGRPVRDDGRANAEGNPFNPNPGRGGNHDSAFGHAQPANPGSQPPQTTMPVVKPEHSAGNAVPGRPVGSPQGNPRFGDGNRQDTTNGGNPRFGNTGNAGGNSHSTNPATGSANPPAPSSGGSTTPTTGSGTNANPNRGGFGNGNHGAFWNRNGNNNGGSGTSTPNGSSPAAPNPNRTPPAAGSNPGSGGGRTNPPSPTPAAPANGGNTGNTGSPVSRPGGGNTAWGQRRNPGGSTGNSGTGNPGSSGTGNPGSNGSAGGAAPAGTNNPPSTYRSLRDRMQQNKADKDKKPAPTPTPPAPAKP